MSRAEEQDRLAEFVALGWSIRRIAAAVGWSPTTVRRRLAEYGLCGYDRSAVALQFHHVEPMNKAFGISERGLTRALDSARAEVQKCVILCANCHAEVEAGVARLPEKLSS